MASFNFSTRQMSAKIVYYGPGLGGKTTSLKYIFHHTRADARGKMVSLATETDRTLFFDLLPLEVGTVAGFHTRIQLYTVPGQVFYNSTRRLVLKGVDGIVFVADSQPAMLPSNVESFRNMEVNLAELGIDLEEIPIVIQYNKRDLPEVCSVAELSEALNAHGWPEFETSAIAGDGIFEVLREISKLTLIALKKQLEDGVPETLTPPVAPSLGNLDKLTDKAEPATPAATSSPAPNPVEAPSEGRSGTPAAAGAAARPAVQPPAVEAPAATTAPPEKPAQAPPPPRAEAAAPATATAPDPPPAAAEETVLDAAPAREMDEEIEIEVISDPPAEGDSRLEDVTPATAAGQVAAGAPEAPEVEGQPEEIAALAESNGRRRVDHDLRLELRPEDLDNACQVSIDLQIRDERDRVLHQVRDVQWDLESVEKLQDVLLHLKIELEREDA